MAMTSSKHPDRALRIAAILLGIFAVVQVIAAFLAIAPEIKLDRAFATRPVTPALDIGSAQTTTAPSSVSENFTQPAPVGPSEETVQRANAFLNQAEVLRSQGNLPAALAALIEADRLVPNEPSVLYALAVQYYEMGRLTDSRLAANRALAVPSIRTDEFYADVYQRLTLLLAQLGAPDPNLSSTGEPLVPTASSPVEGLPDPSTLSLPPSGAGSSNDLMRDNSGIPIGSDFGIVECKLVDGEAGVKKLRIATKGSAGKAVDASDFKVAVYFYEQNDSGQVEETQSKVQSEWLSPPMVWKDEPELLEVRYPLPFEQGDASAMQFHGYVVGIYYKGELQDSRAEPVSLLAQFPLKLSVSETAE